MSRVVKKNDTIEEMKCHGYIVMALFILAPQLWGQDELFWRKMYKGELIEKEEGFDLGETKFELSTPRYQFDLDGDGHVEFIRAIKKDTKDYLIIEDEQKKVIGEYGLPSMGQESSLYKITLSSINRNSRVLLIHFYEGVTKGVEIEGSARIYFVTILDGRMDKLKFSKGPSFWIEKGKFRDQYFRRSYRLTMLDVDGDNDRELVITSRNISKVWKFINLDKGWIEL